MEPCLFRHGKITEMQVYLNSLGVLQWSHVFSDMVSAELGMIVGKNFWLQWSHVFSDMVRRHGGVFRGVDDGLQWSHVFSDMVSETHAGDGRPYRRFNGAMSFQTW